MANNNNFLPFLLFLRSWQIIFNYVDIYLHLECQRHCSDLACDPKPYCCSSCDRFLVSIHLS